MLRKSTMRPVAWVISSRAKAPVEDKDWSILVVTDGMRDNGLLSSISSSTSIDGTYALELSQPFGVPPRSATPVTCASCLLDDDRVTLTTTSKQTR